jgi:Enoyl-(Acyl carrier protein) reductase
LERRCRWGLPRQCTSATLASLWQCRIYRRTHQTRPGLELAAFTEGGQKVAVPREIAPERRTADWRFAQLDRDDARRARVNSISPGIIATPLAQHELNSDIGDGYRAMIAASPANRMAPPDEIAIAASYLLGPDAGFVTGSDLLIDGGVIAAMKAGKLPTPG